jgi:hypothetical protein
MACKMAESMLATAAAESGITAIPPIETMVSEGTGLGVRWTFTNGLG